MSEQAVDRVEYVPTTEEIREYVEIGGEQRPWEEPTPEKDAARAAAFDRWLAAHDAEVLAVRSEALDTLQRIADRLGTSRLGTLYGLAAEMNEALLHITPDAPAPSDAASEREALATIAERDEAEEWADRLAAAIAPADVLGGHSSANNPWQNALDYADRRQGAVSVSREQLEAAAEALEGHDWRADIHPSHHGTDKHYDYRCPLCRPDIDQGYERIVGVVLAALGIEVTD